MVATLAPIAPMPVALSPAVAALVLLVMLIGLPACGPARWVKIFVVVAMVSSPKSWFEQREISGARIPLRESGAGRHRRSLQWTTRMPFLSGARRPRRTASLRRRFLRSSALLLLLLLLPVLGTAWFIRGPLLLRVPHRATVAASPERLRADVERLCTEFAPRDRSQLEGGAAVVRWIAAEWEAAGLEVSVQRYDVNGAAHANVLARRPGLAGSDLGLVVLGAHHDSYRTTPGADDNASGVAALLELARLTRGLSYRRGQLFVAFDTEEPPYFGTEDMGSAFVADALLRSGERVEFMAALDMVGRFSDEPESQTWPLPAAPLFLPLRGNFLAVAGDGEMGGQLLRAKRGLASADAMPVLSLRAPVWFGWTTLSDHSSFRARGLPGLLITDTGPLRNFDYHGAGDLPADLNYEALAAVVQSLQGLLLEWDAAP